MDLLITYPPCFSLHKEHSPVHWGSDGTPVLMVHSRIYTSPPEMDFSSLSQNCDGFCFEIFGKASVDANCLQKQLRTKLCGFEIKSTDSLKGRANSEKPEVQPSTHTAHTRVYRWIISENILILLITLTLKKFILGSCHLSSTQTT